MIKLRIEEILRERGITKTAFAEMLGIKKQNINFLLETRNLDRIQEIADVLGTNVVDLVFSEYKESTINGYVEYKNKIYPIKNIEDFKLLSSIIANDN